MKIGNILIKIILLVFSVLLIWIIGNGLFNSTIVVYDFNPIILIVGIIMYLSILVFIYKKVIPKLEQKKWIVYLCISVFFIICVLVSFFLRLNPTWDMGNVFTIAKNIVEVGTSNETYLYSYPNNIMLTLVYIGIFKIASFWQGVDYIIVATFFNACMITVCVALMYKIAEKLWDKKKALMVLLIALVTTPLYLHAAIYYSDVPSALFTLLAFYLYLQIVEKKGIKNSSLLQILLGIVLFIGIKIKITVSFILIAIFVYEILRGNTKELIQKMSIVLPTLLIGFILFNFIVEPRVVTNKEVIDNYKVPVLHWIMMGLKEEGGYNEEDYLYTFSYSTYQEKEKADIEEINRRISNYNVLSFAEHLNKKINFAWSDGTYFAPEKLRRSPVEQTILQEIVIGKYKNVYKYFPQVMHISMMILIFINVCSILKKKEYTNREIIMAISVFGLILFLLLWENRSRYIFVMVPLMMLLQLNGIEIVSHIKRRKE